MATASRVIYHGLAKNNHRPPPIASGENASGLHITHPHLRDFDCEQFYHYTAHSGHGPSARMYYIPIIGMSTHSSSANRTTPSNAIASSTPLSEIFRHTAHRATSQPMPLPFQRQHTATSSTFTRFITQLTCAFPLPLLLQLCYLTSAHAQYKNDAYWATVKTSRNYKNSYHI